MDRTKALLQSEFLALRGFVFLKYTLFNCEILKPYASDLNNDIPIDHRNINQSFQ